MKKTGFIVILMLSFLPLFAQQTDTITSVQDTLIKKPETKESKVKRDTRPWNQRIALGLGSSFWITPSQTYLELSPVLAYRFPKTLITGIGYRYIYRHERVVGQNLNAWGPSAFARVKLLKRLYFWTEYEILKTENIPTIAGQELTVETSTTDSWFAGLGYIRSVGRKGRGGISMQLLYNMLYNREDLNPYYSPVTYRVGYYF
jgi:hypothetical protein